MAIRGPILAWLPPVAGILVATLALLLGQWQLGRAEQKKALQALWDSGDRLPVLSLEEALAAAEPPLYRHCRVSGEYAAPYQVYLDNRVYQRRAGFHVVVPLREADGSRRMLINRGWLAGDPSRQAPPYATVPAGQVSVAGILVPARSRYIELAAETVDGAVWQNLDLDRYRQFYDAALPDLMLLQTSDSGDGLVRDWPRPDFGVDKHISYAGQWFALAATSLALTLIHQWRRRGRAARAS